jgi:hypothetical protein
MSEHRGLSEYFSVESTGADYKILVCKTQGVRIIPGTNRAK